MRPLFTSLALLLSLMVAAAPSGLSAQNRLPPAPYAYQQLEDPAQEAKAKSLMEELRCLVCQGQSIADSDAPLAGDMRSQVREKIAAGESPEAIRQFLIDRYGSWVTYDPPFGVDTAILYLAPLLALAFGLWLAFGRIRAQGGEGDPVVVNGDAGVKGDQA
jgi:cytochrome c-type biogenesis protein CcmH